ncbi:hypothetical protein [Salegentibacter sp. Hel_I_6]|uniref:hypothetical protein n=1 Tax=Salegentibacter sp. Hel_I_6 TaxID=1250278 RepID=UPI0005684240|nr:hypothetical protein [Salegentibacter sp. Hel_I_6]
MSNISRLEELNKEVYGIRFLKKYPILEKIELTRLEINLIELILSFQNQNKQLQMRYDKIGYYIGVQGEYKNKGVGNIVLKLKKAKIINTKPEKYGINRGAKSSLSVNLDKLISLIEHKVQNENSSKKNEGEVKNVPEEVNIHKYTGNADFLKILRKNFGSSSVENTGLLEFLEEFEIYCVDKIKNGDKSLFNLKRDISYMIEKLKDDFPNLKIA